MPNEFKETTNDPHDPIVQAEQHQSTYHFARTSARGRQNDEGQNHADLNAPAKTVRRGNGAIAISHCPVTS